VVWLDLIDLGSRIFHLDSNAALWIALLMAVLYVIVELLPDGLPGRWANC